MKHNNALSRQRYRSEGFSGSAMPPGRQRGSPSTFAASVALAVTLSGCAVGPDYVAPTTQFAPFHNTIT
uniref:hypothetical protein n=1 Tax=Trinickia mobilis TaxID=2816356 RepID=UPI001A8F1BA0